MFLRSSLLSRRDLTVLVSCDHILVGLRLGSRTVLVPCPASDSCPQLVKYVSFFVAIQRAEYCEADSVG